LRVLVKKGAIEMLPGTWRGIRPLIKSAPLGLPLIGRVAAGQPILAEEHIEQRYKVDPSLFRPRADYLLRVKGMSMCEIGILAGDLLPVHRAREANSGEVVVARIDDEVTVKRFRRRGNIVRLLPENPDFEPIVIDLREQEMTIEGIAVGVIRNGGSL